MTEEKSAPLPTDTRYKAVNYIETYTGKMFFPLHPEKSDVSIIDIAHHLSNQCRYSGATEFFYSTAQHCCILASYVENVRRGSALDCLQILIHDAAEAYLVDMPRPVKQHMPEFRKWDYAIQTCIREWLGLGGMPIPDWQDELDSRIIIDERAQVMSDSGNDWGHRMEGLRVKVEPWSAKEAEQQFLFRFAAYYDGAFNRPAYLRESWGIMGPNLTTRYSTASDDAVVADVFEVDLLGGVGRVKLKTPDGMLVRDPQAGKLPRAAWKWIHGNFELVLPELTS